MFDWLVSLRHKNSYLVEGSEAPMLLSTHLSVVSRSGQIFLSSYPAFFARLKTDPSC